MGFKTTFMIEWGDCDEAGIVFYPNYFYWLDCTFHRWLRDIGMGHSQLRKTLGVDLPLMDVGCNFRKPARYDQELIIKAEVAEWMEKRFRIEYEMFIADQRIGTGHELRAWAVQNEDGNLRGAPIDPEFKRRILDGAS